MEIALLLILTGLLSVIMFFSLKKLIESLNKDSQKYYFKTMQALDKKIEEKNKETNEEIINNEFYEEDKKKVEVKEGIDKSLLDIYNNADYENGNALKIANKVDAIFKIDEDKIISDFVKNNTVDENYKYYQSIYDRFSPNLIYKLKMLNKDNQINEISKMLNEDEYKVFYDYLKHHKFKLNRFLLDFELNIEKTNPVIEVITGDKNKNYNHINPYVKTSYSDDIYKGIIRVTERMSYTDVQKILDNSDEKIVKKYYKYIDHFKLMEELAKILKAKRMKQVYLNLDVPESKIVLDNITGKCIDVNKYETSFAN